MATKELIKNIDKGEIYKVAELVDYAEGKVVSRTLAQNSALSLTVFAFCAGEGLSSHAASGDAMVQILEGEALITIKEVEYRLQAGELIVMPANIPHAVDAEQPFKMLLTVVRPIATKETC